MLSVRPLMIKEELMKKAIQRGIAVFLVVLSLLSIAPISELAKVDFSSAFGFISSAVEKALKLNVEMGDFEIVSSNRGFEKAQDTDFVFVK